MSQVDTVEDSYGKDNENDDSSSDESNLSDYNTNKVDDNKKLSLEEDEENLLILPPEDFDGECAPEETEEPGEDGDDTGNKNVHPLNSFKLQEDAASFIHSEQNYPDSRKKRKRRKLYTICLSNCRYESVRRVSKRFGFREVGDEDDFNLIWTDFSVNIERVNSMKKYQKINHFPGMLEICRKDSLARNMTRMSRLFSKDYNIAPKSWCLPADYADLQSYSRQKKHKTYIMKPDAGCQGRGIWITKNVKDIKPSENMVCQVYMSRPLLIDGYKFDIRIYVLVTSCDPLRIFAFKDGLVRFTTMKYSEPSYNNVDNIYMHLTNYSLQKHSERFVRDNEECGTKRRITTLNRWFVDHGYNIEKIWNDVDDVIIKTLISAHTLLKHNYRTCFPNHVRGSACFEILGFDVMLDRRLKPYLIEVNHSPSFHTDSKLDKEIKEALIWDTLQLVNFGAVDKKRIIEEEKRKVRERLFQKQNRKDLKEEVDKEQAKYIEQQERYENNHLGNFRRIYPNKGSDKYDKYFSTNVSLYQETAAFKARTECARIQREEIRQKQERFDLIVRKKDRHDVRPESPGDRPKRKIPVTPQTYKAKKLPPSYLRPKVPDKNAANSSSVAVIDTSRPQDINDDDEIERLSGLLQRDNLLRALGIVEIVYKALHNTAGTMAYQHTSIYQTNLAAAGGGTGVGSQQQQTQPMVTVQPPSGLNAITNNCNSHNQHHQPPHHHLLTNANNKCNYQSDDYLNGDNPSSKSLKKSITQTNQNFKSRTVKSSQANKLLPQPFEFSVNHSSTSEKSRTAANNFLQRFTPPFNLQNPKSLYRMNTNFSEYQNTNGLLNILKFQTNQDSLVNDQLNSLNMELHGLSVMSKTAPRNPISIQQLPFGSTTNQSNNSGRKIANHRNSNASSHQTNNNTSIYTNLSGGNNNNKSITKSDTNIHLRSSQHLHHHRYQTLSSNAPPSNNLATTTTATATTIVSSNNQNNNSSTTSATTTDNNMKFKELTLPTVT